MLRAKPMIWQTEQDQQIARQTQVEKAIEAN